MIDRDQAFVKNRSVGLLGRRLVALPSLSLLERSFKRLGFHLGFFRVLLGYQLLGTQTASHGEWL